VSLKFFIYLLVIPFVFWVVESLRIEQIFKKNRRNQILVFYVLLTLGISYLVVNFIYDFYEVSRIIY
jgi:uncharacterized integral membrane protein (TIGR02327 family)